MRNTLSVVSFFCSFLLNTLQAQEPRLGQTEVYKPTTSDKARTFYNEATIKLNKSDFKAAVELYKKAIVADTNYIDAYDNLALSFRRLNLLDSAMKYYKISNRKFPSGVLALQNMAVVESIRGNYSSAISNYQEIIRLQPDNPEGYYGLAEIQLKTGKLDDALRNASVAERIYRETNNPYIGDAYYLTCWIYVKKENYTQAKRYLLLAKENGVKVNAELEKALD